MRTVAILPVKSFSAAKQRLSGLLGSGSRQALALAMFSDVLASLRHVSRVESCVVVTSDPVAESAARGNRVTVLPDPGQEGQSAAALIGVRQALASGYERVLLVPGDTPLLDPAEIDALLARCEADGIGAGVVPDRHGRGTNGLLLAPPDAMDPSFGPGSLERHVTSARDSGVSHRVERVPSLAVDVDTPDDLSELAGLLEHRRGQAPLTRGALRQLDRSRVRPSVAGRPSAAQASGLVRVGPAA